MKLQLLSFRRRRSPSEWPSEPLLLPASEPWLGCHEPPSGRPRNPIGMGKHKDARSALRFCRQAISGRIPASPAIPYPTLVRCPGEGRRRRSSRHELRKLQGFSVTHMNSTSRARVDSAKIQGPRGESVFLFPFSFFFYADFWLKLWKLVSHARKLQK
jgi:hypothetical protein